MINGLKRKNHFALQNEQAKFHNVKTNSNVYNFGEAARFVKDKTLRNNPLDLRKLLTNQILINQSNDNFSFFLSHIEPTSLSFGQDIQKPGDASRYVYFPESAVISHLNVLSNGSTAEVAMVGNEGVTGLFSIFGSQSSTCWTEVTVPGTAFKIEVEILKREFAQNAELQNLLHNYLSTYVAQISQKAVCNAYHLAEERFCTWLLMLHDRIQSESLLLTQDKISRHLGVHRPSVTHVAQGLRDKAVISYVRGYINILDRTKLETLACECYSVIKTAIEPTCFVQ